MSQLSKVIVASALSECKSLRTFAASPKTIMVNLRKATTGGLEHHVSLKEDLEDDFHVDIKKLMADPQVSTMYPSVLKLLKNREWTDWGNQHDTLFDKSPTDVDLTEFYKKIWDDSADRQLGFTMKMSTGCLLEVGLDDHPLKSHIGGYVSSVNGTPIDNFTQFKSFVRDLTTKYDPTSADLFHFVLSVKKFRDASVDEAGRCPLINKRNFHRHFSSLIFLLVFAYSSYFVFLFENPRSPPGHYVFEGLQNDPMFLPPGWGNVGELEPFTQGKQHALDQLHVNSWCGELDQDQQVQMLDRHHDGKHWDDGTCLGWTILCTTRNCAPIKTAIHDAKKMLLSERQIAGLQRQFALPWTTYQRSERQKEIIATAANLCHAVYTAQTIQTDSRGINRIQQQDGTSHDEMNLLGAQDPHALIISQEYDDYTREEGDILEANDPGWQVVKEQLFPSHLSGNLPPVDTARVIWLSSENNHYDDKEPTHIVYLRNEFTHGQDADGNKIVKREFSIEDSNSKEGAVGIRTSTSNEFAVPQGDLTEADKDLIIEAFRKQVQYMFTAVWKSPLDELLMGWYFNRDFKNMQLQVKDLVKTEDVAEFFQLYENSELDVQEALADDHEFFMRFVPKITPAPTPQHPSCDYQASSGCIWILDGAGACHSDLALDYATGWDVDLWDRVCEQHEDGVCHHCTNPNSPTPSPTPP